MADFPFARLPLETRYLILYWRKRHARQHHYEQFRRNLGEIHESFCYYLMGDFFNLSRPEDLHKHSVNITIGTHPHHTAFSLAHSFTGLHGMHSSRHTIVVRPDREDHSSFRYSYDFGPHQIVEKRLVTEESFVRREGNHRLQPTLKYDWHQHLCPILTPPDWVSGSVCSGGPPDLYISDGSDGFDSDTGVGSRITEMGDFY